MFSAVPVPADDQFAPDRKQQHIEAVSLRLVEYPVHIGEILLLRLKKIILFQGFYPAGVSHLFIKFRVQDYHLKNGKALFLSGFHIVQDIVPLEPRRNRPGCVREPDKGGSVRFFEVPSILRNVKFFHAQYNVLLYISVFIFLPESLSP